MSGYVSKSFVVSRREYRVLSLYLALPQPLLRQSYIYSVFSLWTFTASLLNQRIHIGNNTYRKRDFLSLEYSTSQRKLMIFPKRQLNVTSWNRDVDRPEGTQPSERDWSDRLYKNLCRLQFSATTCNEVNFIDMRMKLSQRNYYPCRWTAITS